MKTVTLAVLLIISLLVMFFVWVIDVITKIGFLHWFPEALGLFFSGMLLSSVSRKVKHLAIFSVIFFFFAFAYLFVLPAMLLPNNFTDVSAFSAHFLNVFPAITMSFIFFGFATFGWLFQRRFGQ